MASAGPNFPTAYSDNSTIGTVAWTNPINVLAEDGAFATAALGNSQSHYLTGSTFGFNIPAGSIINGIVVEWKRRQATAGPAVTDNAVRIIKTSNIGATDRSSGTSWTTTNTWISYGSATDLWGETWAAADINASGFGAALSAQVTDPSLANTAQVDAVRITVYYTPTGTIDQLKRRRKMLIPPREPRPAYQW